MDSRVRRAYRAVLGINGNGRRLRRAVTVIAATAVIAAAPITPTASSLQTTSADPCVSALGTLDATTTTASGSGIVAVDSGCTSSLRDPGDTASTYYARRHTFTLAAAATVSVSMGPSSSWSYLVLSDSSDAVVGRDQGRNSSRYSSAEPARLDHLVLAAGTYTLIGWTGADRLWGGLGDDNLQGDAGDDALWGGPGDDTLRGDGHNDQLDGGPGRDTLRGGDGADRVYGGEGDDTLYGGGGVDYINGGPGADTCTHGETTAACEDESLRRS